MVNQVRIAGRIVADAVTKDLGNSKITTFAIAVNEKFTAKNGEEREIVSFFDVELIGASDLKKGDLVVVEGRLRQDRWETPTGEKRSRVKIVAFKITPQSSEKAKDVESVQKSPVQKQSPQKQPQTKATTYKTYNKKVA